MKNYKQWVNWDIVPGKNGRLTKVPVDAVTGIKINPHDPINQLYYEEAKSFSDKVGFVITENDNFFLLDIDHAKINDQWSNLAVDLSNKFINCYQEVSISGTALHIIGSVTTITLPHSCKNSENNIELYTKKRFVAITENSVTGDASVIVDAEFSELVENYFQPINTGGDWLEEWPTGPALGWHGPADDDELIKRMLKASSSGSRAFNDRKATFKDLWECNIDALRIAFPHKSLSFDASSADQSLLLHLAFWTGKDCYRMERLFNLSGLVREKWIEREDYRRRSINFACKHTRNIYGEGVSMHTAMTAGMQVAQQVLMGDLTPITKSPGFQLMTPESQIEYFAGCVYICDENKIIIPNRRLLKKQQFDAFYGGWVFSMDAENDKTSKSAWDVFTMSQAVKFPKVDGQKFCPSNHTGLIIENDGSTYINTYTPATVPSVPGDISKFTGHLEKMIPNHQDREILISWLAAVVQYPGKKFGWAPLIQGTYGNGKSMIGECMAEAVGRHYTHFPEASEITEKYNDWLTCKLLQCVDEMYTGADKYKTMEKFKAWVQHRGGIEIRAMQTGKIMHDICCNFLLFTNHKDAIVKTREDRRFAVFYTAQQTLDDLESNGWTGSYFPDLFNWLSGDGRYQGQTPGYHHITYWLRHYNILDQYNPALLCHRAPTTTSTVEAIQESYGTAEQLIQVAVDTEKAGFRGGYVSAIQVMSLFRYNHCTVTPKRIAGILQTLGYIKHPILPQGRSTCRNHFDKGRPVIYANDECIRRTEGFNSTEVTSDYLLHQDFNDGGNIFGG